VLHHGIIDTTEAAVVLALKSPWILQRLLAFRHIILAANSRIRHGARCCSLTTLLVNRIEPRLVEHPGATILIVGWDYVSIVAKTFELVERVIIRDDFVETIVL
jgi:hypothetical protein